jgi:cytochrome P450
VQTLAWWNRPLPFFERCRARYGKRFTTGLIATPPFVQLCDPDEAKEVFTAPPEVLHPGEGARILEPVVGRHSVILLDEAPHLEQRRLMLPAFHGERMARLEGLMTEVAEREAERLPRGRPVAVHDHMQALTLEIILRAVFGLDEGERLDALRTRVQQLLEWGASPIGLFPPLQRDYGPGSPGRRFNALRAEIDELIFSLIDERRAEGADRDDLLAMFLVARHADDDSLMTHRELRDELITMLVAGHETTASELAWGFAELVRAPRVLDRLTAEVRAGDDDAYLGATVTEILRRRPVLPNAEPRLTKQPVTIGGWDYPEGVVLGVNAYLVHHDETIYERPYAFRPERFLEDEGGRPTGTYTFCRSAAGAGGASARASRCSR